MTAPLIDVTGARRRRLRERRRRRLIVGAVLVGVVALAAGAVWLVGWSPVFTARTVVTTGLSAVAEKEVLAAADVPMGTPLARLDTEAVAGRVAGLDAVDTVTVAVRPPDVVEIQVTERSVALVVASGGAFTWIDTAGVAFNTSEKAPKGSVRARANLNDTELLIALATVADALPPSVKKDVELLSARTGESITVSLSQGRRILWGSADESAFKAEVIVPLLTVDATVYDVSAPAHPTTR
ncbi:MAG: cell division protein FtsQ/DivIB [Propioniciclava sp.]